MPFAEDGLAVEVHHLFLGAADEVPGSGGGGDLPERLLRPEDPVVEQAPQMVVWGVLPHVRRSCQEQQVAGRPRERLVLGGGRTTGERFRELVALRFPHASALGGGAQLVGLVKDDKVVRSGLRIG